jgi:hypothetical protein
MNLAGGNFAGFDLLNISFSMDEGTAPGTGTIEFADPLASPSPVGNLYMTDGVNWIQLANINILHIKDVLNKGGASRTATIADCRCKWGFGWVTGRYNDITKNKAAIKRKAGDLFGDIFQSMNHDLVWKDGLKDQEIYPDVEWEMDSPAKALNDLLEKTGWSLSIDVNGKGVVSLPNNSSVTLGDDRWIGKDQDNEPLYCRPKKIVIRGDRKIIQETFTDLEPVGVEIASGREGWILPMDDLSYAPRFVNGGWSKSIIDNFHNIAGESARTNAEKCIFKWYRVKLSVEDQTKKLPLLNVISNRIKNKIAGEQIEDGAEIQEKPYILMTSSVWDGKAWVTQSDVRVADGYTIDHKLGIIKFDQPVGIVEDIPLPWCGKFISVFRAAIFKFVAAYERNKGDDDDFYTFEMDVGGAYPPMCKHEGSIKLFIGGNSDQIIQQECDDKAAEVAEAFHREKYTNLSPRESEYFQVIPYTPLGRLTKVSWKVDRSSGAYSTAVWDIDLGPNNAREKRRIQKLADAERKTQHIHKNWHGHTRNGTGGHTRIKTGEPSKKKTKGPHAAEGKVCVNNTHSAVIEPGSAVIISTAGAGGAGIFGATLNAAVKGILGVALGSLTQGGGGVVAIGGEPQWVKTSGTVEAGDVLGFDEANPGCAKKGGKYANLSVLGIDGNYALVNIGAGGGGGETFMALITTVTPSWASNVRNTYSITKIDGSVSYSSVEVLMGHDANVIYNPLTVGNIVQAIHFTVPATDETSAEEKTYILTAESEYHILDACSVYG